MGRNFLLLLLLLVVSLSKEPSSAVAEPPPPAEAPSPATALFVLGDSSVNCGDNNLFLPFLPFNFPASLCSSSLLPDLIAERMGLPSPPSFYLANRTAEALAAGANFGSAPATILSGGGIFLLHSLSQQVRLVAETLQLVRLELGHAAARRLTSSALFLLSFGKDDHIALLAAGASPDPKSGRRGFSRILASHMIRAVQDLYDGDARRVAVMGVAPLGCAPRVVFEGFDGLDGHDCVDEANEIIAGYNAKLLAELAKLSSRLPDAEIVFCDVYRGMMEIISNPRVYGFENVRDACCGVGRFGGMAGCLTVEMACAEPQKYIWWDFYSPTKHVNNMLANWSWIESDMCICKPAALQRVAASDCHRPRIASVCMD